MKTGLELLIYFECFGFVDFSVSEFQSLNIIEFFSVTTSPQWVQDSEFGVQGISACALCRSSSWLTLASVRRRHLTLDTHDTHLPTPTHRQEQPEDVLLSLCPCPTHWHWGSQVRWRDVTVASILKIHHRYEGFGDTLPFTPTAPQLQANI